jgi:SAM domain (Sterile alpha motif)
MDVAAWLRGLGLGQYAQLFRDNDIDGEILCGMTAEDLKELGISSFGHRAGSSTLLPPWGESPRRVMWLYQQRARHLLPPHLRQSEPNAGS